MRHPKAIRPVVENMESKLLLTAHALSGLSAAHIVPLLPVAPINLQVTIHGTYTSPKHNPDSGEVIKISGSSNVNGLGKVSAGGSIVGLGNVASGQAQGLLTLNASKGRLLVYLVGPVQPGFSPVPLQYHFTVVSGTGTLKSIAGSGDLTINLIPSHPSNSKPHGASGRFTAMITSFTSPA